MKITENQLREMVRKTITSLLRESEEDEDIEIADDWYGPDEFDSDEIEEPTDDDLDMGDDFLDDEFDDSPISQDKKDKVDNLMRSILSKQGYSGDRLERELEKRRTKDKPDASTRWEDSWFDEDNGMYDSLYESINRNVKKSINKALSKQRYKR